jgi:hypothetical protein
MIQVTPLFRGYACGVRSQLRLVRKGFSEAARWFARDIDFCEMRHFVNRLAVVGILFRKDEILVLWGHLSYRGLFLGQILQ